MLVSVLAEYQQAPVEHQDMGQDLAPLRQTIPDIGGKGHRTQDPAQKTEQRQVERSANPGWSPCAEHRHPDRQGQEQKKAVFLPVI